MSFRTTRDGAINRAAYILWRFPGRFGVAQTLGPRFGLRCVVFHNIADSQRPFTNGIRVTVSPRQFETALRFLTAYYVPVSLQDVLSDCEGRGLPNRAVLVTFDDAYASVSETALPLCRKYRVPAVFFINASVLDNRRLLPDNLICYVACEMGISAVNAAARTISGHETIALHSLADVFDHYLPSLSLAKRGGFLEELCQVAKINEARLAKEAGLYLTSRQLRDLHAANFEIGNHTYTHTHCRFLSPADLVAEIERNKAELEEASGRAVRAFSQPYGSSQDLTPKVIGHLKDSGHKAAFLSESVANRCGGDPYRLDRVSTCNTNDEELFLDLEVKPRLRAIRNLCFRNSGSQATRPAAPALPKRQEQGIGAN